MDDWKLVEKQIFDKVIANEVFDSTFKISNVNYLSVYYKCNAEFNYEKDGENNNLDIDSTPIKVVQSFQNFLLPLVEINTFDAYPVINREDYIEANMSISMNGNILYNGDLSLKGRGNTSWDNSPKKPYTLKFNSKDEILGMPKSKKWVLVANYFDKSLLRNKYASILGNNIYNNIDWNPSFESVNVVLNGEYLGVYNLGESVKIEENRVNIQSLSDVYKGKKGISDVNGDGKIDLRDGGFLIEVNSRKDENFNFDTKYKVHFSLKDPDTDDFIKDSVVLPKDVEDFIVNTVQNAENSLFLKNSDDLEIGYRKYFDLDSFVDWYIVNQFMQNTDSFKFLNSAYMYYNPSDSKLHMGPDWDYDISCGNYYTHPDPTEELRCYWFSRMLLTDSFKTALKARWSETKNLLYQSINQQIQEMASELKVSADLNFIRWPILGTYVWPNMAGYEERTTY